MLYFRLPRPGDVEQIHADLRPQDRIEAEASSGLSALAVLGASVVGSDPTYVIAHGDQPLALFGTNDTGILGLHGLWLLGTDGLMKHQREFLRQSRPMIRFLFLKSGADLFCNHSLATNTAHHRWLQWCGATLYDPLPYGPRGVMFTPFTLKRNPNV